MPCKQARNWTLVFLHVTVEITSFKITCQLCTIVIVYTVSNPSPTHSNSTIDNDVILIICHMEKEPEIG